MCNAYSIHTYRVVYRDAAGELLPVSAEQFRRGELPDVQDLYFDAPEDDYVPRAGSRARTATLAVRTIGAISRFLFRHPRPDGFTWEPPQSGGDPDHWNAYVVGASGGFAYIGYERITSRTIGAPALHDLASPSYYDKRAQERRAYEKGDTLTIHPSAARKPLGELPPPPSPKAGTCYQTEHVHPLMAPDDAWEITSVGFGCMGDTTIGGRVWAYLGRRRIDGALCHVWEAVDGARGPAIAQTLAYHGTAP